MSFTLHPEVENDLLDAANYLRLNASPKTAARFLQEFRRVANLLVEFPGFGTPMSRDRRIYPLKLFKYSVVYRAVEGKVRILVVRHQKRKPSFGGGRT